MRSPSVLLLAVFSALAFPVQQSAVPASAQSGAGKFVDVTDALGVHFRNVSTHTPKKYLIETMGAGVALFDYDNDGRLDIYLVNGAPIADPTPK